MNRPLYLHVGCRKTGTGALQQALWSSTEALAAQGVGTPLVGRQPHVRELLHPLGWRYGPGFSSPLDRAGLEDLGAKLRGAPGERVLLSVEDLAEAGPPEVSAFMDVVQATFDVHLVVSARDWAQQLPSEWQEVLKERVLLDYETFLASVRDRDGPEGDRFWRRQDVLDVCERWGAGLEPARIHVITVPPASVERDAVYRLFAEVVGFDPSSLTRPTRDINASFGYAEAEMLRRLNVTLADRLSDQEYTAAIRSTLVNKVLARGASPRIPLPPHHVEWVRRMATERLGTIVERGYRLHGDHTLLVPAPDVGRPIPPVDGTTIGEAALRTLGDFAIAQSKAARKRAGRAQAARVSPAVRPQRAARLWPYLRKTLAGRIRSPLPVRDVQEPQHASSRPRGFQDIAGWFSWLDRKVFSALLESQANSPLGTLVELGAFEGRSAVIIGDHVRPGERFVVVDLFGTTEGQDISNIRELQQSYRTLTRQKFESNYLALHDELPEIVQGPSSEVLDYVEPGSVRFVHVDASHLYEHVHGDATAAKKMLRRGGIVVFDDYRKQTTPGVAAAVWQAVFFDGLLPVALTPQKLYGVYEDPDPVDAAIRDLVASDQRFKSAEHEILGRTVLRVEMVKEGG
jgi:hypothetical protein